MTLWPVRFVAGKEVRCPLLIPTNASNRRFSFLPTRKFNYSLLGWSQNIRQELNASGPKVIKGSFCGGDSRFPLEKPIVIWSTSLEGGRKKVSMRPNAGRARGPYLQSPLGSHIWCLLGRGAWKTKLLDFHYNKFRANSCPIHGCFLKINNSCPDTPSAP